MKKRKNASKQYVICIDNTDYLVSLDLYKIYEVLPDERAAVDDCIRVIDESGEDYLYSSESFVPIELPQKVIVSMERRAREATVVAEKSKQTATPKGRVARTTKTQNRPRALRD